MSSSSPSSSSSYSADALERTLANVRFSKVARGWGPRLPVPLDLDRLAPEAILAAARFAATALRVLERHRGAVPPGTLALLVANAGVFVKPRGVAFGDVCLNPHAVVHLNQLERLVTSAFVHRDLFHLLANASGVLEDGAFLEQLWADEDRDGDAVANVPTFLLRAGTLLLTSQATLVALSYFERRRVGGGADAAWLGDAYDALVSGGSNRERSSSSSHRRRNDLLPFYTSGVVGFSGVNFAMRAVSCRERSESRRLGSGSGGASIALVLGLVPVPMEFAFWGELAVATAIAPASGTFAAHLSGCVAGVMYVNARRWAGAARRAIRGFFLRVPGGGGGGGGGYRGRGRRLGGGAGGGGGGGRPVVPARGGRRAGG